MTDGSNLAKIAGLIMVKNQKVAITNVGSAGED